MAKLIQRRRGTTVEHNVFTGAIGEITHDTSKNTLVIHDDVTVGGFPLAREDLNNVSLANLIGVSELKTSDGADGQVLTTDGNGNISFKTVDTSIIAVGGDLSGTVSNATIRPNTISVTEINVTEGTGGQVLTTDGAGNLSFTHSNLGGDLSGTVANAQIVAGSVGNLELATDAVSALKISDGSVTSTKLASNSVSTTNIVDLNVTTDKINDFAVTSSKLSSDSVTTIQITDANVTDQKLAPTGVMPAWDGTALTDLPYDISFIAGYNSTTDVEDVVIQTYGKMVMARTGTFLGEAGFMETISAGSSVIVDVEKNGSSIYSVKPQFDVGNNVMTVGTLSTTTFSPGDRITFKVTQIGSATAGQGLQFMLKCKV